MTANKINIVEQSKNYPCLMLLHHLDKWIVSFDGRNPAMVSMFVCGSEALARKLFETVDRQTRTCPEDIERDMFDGG